jgi:hypothetical protein
MKSGIWTALSAAVIFGLSAPIAKFLTGQASPLLLAGLIYTGSGIGHQLVIDGACDGERKGWHRFAAAR